MEYTTRFEGALKITPELNVSQRLHLASFFCEDRREHPEWDAPDTFNYIDISWNGPDKNSIRWDGSEKTYGFVDQLNFITKEMIKVCPTFKLTGELLAQGEDTSDVWKVKISDMGTAYQEDVVLTDKHVKCPKCGEEITL